MTLSSVNVSKIGRDFPYNAATFSVVPNKRIETKIDLYILRNTIKGFDFLAKSLGKMKDHFFVAQMHDKA